MTTRRTLRKSSTSETQFSRHITDRTLSAPLWSTVAKILAATGAVGGLVLHLIGYVSHQFYLGAWGIDSGLFPQQTDDIIVLGYYAFVDRVASIFSTLNYSQFWSWLGIGLLLTIYIFTVYKFARWLSNNKTIHLVKKIPGWISELSKIFALTIMTLAGIPVALFFAVFFLAIPAFLGENFGKTHAERQLTTFVMGCNQDSSAHMCIELCKDKISLARGFLIESSESHIAVFDVNRKRALAFEREGTELIADTPRMLNEKVNVTKVLNTTCSQIASQTKLNELALH